MYQYDERDKRLVHERASQLGGQVARRKEGDIAEDEFKPLRLQNGLYMQLHAYMLRVAIPYGLLSSAQLRTLAHIARVYDRGYGHFTTRQNIQYNFPKLEEVPNLLHELADVEMHAIQTSGNCVRNITSDPYAGVARDEIEDPRPWCEILRQWSTFHPEFAFLPRKFKIAVTGARQDRAAVAVHDIGLRLVENEAGEVGFEVQVGGGQGRTPLIAEVIRKFLPKRDLLSYCEAILRVYNRFGRRDNKFKARIKIIVKALGRDKFAEMVEAEHDEILKSGIALALEPDDVAKFQKHFEPPAYKTLDDGHGTTAVTAALLGKDRTFARWAETNVVPHKVPGYAIVALSLKSDRLPPGDVTAEQMDAIADLSDEFSLSRIVVTHRQNLVFTDVEQSRLPELHRRLAALDLASPNLGRVTDVVACPGLDYCALANARSINIAEIVQARFRELEHEERLGELTLNVSGCINACGHHHVGNIGILGIDKQGVEHYQLMLGGASDNDASLGEVLGRAFTENEIGDAIETVLRAYIALRSSEAEKFIETYRRLGAEPFKEAVYADHPGPAGVRGRPSLTERRNAAAGGE